MSGKLVLVATPIGNLGDLSPRAREAFEAADLIACEDTRHTGRLLAKLGIKKPLISLHEHNERQRAPRLLANLNRGETVVLVSDAGTPLVSDPGYVLVREALASGVELEHIAGPSAVIVALVVSGLPPYPFTFAGFAPPKTGKRRRFFDGLASLTHTLVFFETPHRIAASLADALDVLGDRPAAVTRELSKLHEEVIRGSLSEVLGEIESRSAVKGEITVVLGGASRKRTSPGHGRPGKARESG